MKSILLFCLLVPAFAFGQPETVIPAQPKHEMGLNLFSISDLGNRPHAQKGLVDFGFFNGIYYKYHTGKNAWRASFNYYQNVIDIHNADDIWFYNSLGTKKAGETKVGFEHNFCSGRFSPFIFSDLTFTYSKYKGEEEGSGDIIVYQKRSFNIESFEYGITGGVGAKYQITKNIVVSLETSFNGFYSVSEDLLNPYSYSHKNKGYGYRYNPINRLGLAVAF